MGKLVILKLYSNEINLYNGNHNIENRNIHFFRKILKF